MSDNDYHDVDLEALLLAELKLAGIRSNRIRQMTDNVRLSELGRLLVGRYLQKARQDRMNAMESDSEPYQGDPEIMSTKGPLGNDAAGGSRVIRGTKSMS